MSEELPGQAHDLATRRRLFWAVIVTGLFMLAEAVGGWLSGSLALLADAGHMFSDLMALLLAFAAVKIAERPSDEKRSFGYHRFQVIAAFVNGAVLIAVVAWIVVEAVERLIAPQAVISTMMMVVAALGLLANGVVYVILHPGGADSLNIRAALIHVFGDILGSIAALGAGLVIYWTGWTPIDPLLSLIVGALILRSAWLILKQTTHILMEGAPTGVDVGRIRGLLMAEIPEIEDAHHIHAWSLTPERPMVTLHVQIGEGAHTDIVLKKVQALLTEKFGVDHVTVQIERQACTDEPVAPAT